jgi:zinc and cadmium transporter
MTWLWVVIAVVLDGAVALVGGLLPERWLARYRGPMLGLATGTLLASGLGELFPEALASTGVVALAWMAGAMVLVGVTERASARRGHHRMEPVVPVALLGSDALHNIGDGMAIAAAFLVSGRLGVFTSAAVLVHELPEEIADYALLRAAGMTKRTALAGLAVVQLTAGIGAVGTLAAASLLARANGPILAVASGLFVYISAFDLVPELVRARTLSGLVAGVIGAVIVLGLS